MATKNLSKEEKLTAEEKMIGTVSNFFQKNRILVIIIAAVIVVGLITAIITVNAINNAKEKAQIRITELEQEYANMLAEETPDWASLEAELKSMIKGSTYASVKASYLLGLCYYDQEKYAEAEQAFADSFNLNTKIYLAPLSLVNEAACAEAQGKTTAALDLYNQVYNDYMESGVAPKALFNVARIYMQQGNTQLAQATFAQVADYYPSSEYGMLAKNLANVL